MITSQHGYWDRVATEKRFSHPLHVDWLTSRLNPESRILDCGCGYGRTLADLHAAGYHNLTGLDFSEGMLRRCQSEVPDAAVVRNDGKSLPLKTNSVEAVLLFAVLTCIPADDDQRALLSEVERIFTSQRFALHQ